MRAVLPDVLATPRDGSRAFSGTSRVKVRRQQTQMLLFRGFCGFLICPPLALAPLQGAFQWMSLCCMRTRPLPLPWLPLTAVAAAAVPVRADRVCLDGCSCTDFHLSLRRCGYGSCLKSQTNLQTNRTVNREKDGYFLSDVVMQQQISPHVNLIFTLAEPENGGKKRVGDAISENPIPRKA